MEIEREKENVYLSCPLLIRTVVLEEGEGD